MPGVSPSLCAQGRSAYRLLLRSAAVAFKGDERVLNAFRLKARNDFVAGRATTNEEEYLGRLSLAMEVAQFLRKNLVQGVRESGSDAWKLRWRNEIELGDNDTIKQALRKRAQSQTASSIAIVEQTSPSSSKPVKYLSKKALFKARNNRKVPVLLERDIEEAFIRGSGPGGQSINKTRSTVSLVHKPSGIRITCQETRSLSQNRQLARRMLLERLDQAENPGLSKRGIEIALERRRKRNRVKKARKCQKEASSSTVVDFDFLGRAGRNSQDDAGCQSQ